MNQLTFGDVEYSNRRKNTKCKELLDAWKRLSHALTSCKAMK